MKAITRVLTSAAILLSAGCMTGEQLGGPRPLGSGRTPAPGTRTGGRVAPPPAPTPRAAYVTRMEPVLDGRVLSAWDAAGSAALRVPLYVPPAFEELLDFPPDLPLAASYRFFLQRGERIDVAIRTDRGAAPFADIFELIDSTMFRHAFAAEPEARGFSFTARTDGVHVLRVQPPATGDGRYAVTVRSPTAKGLVFPVAGASPAAIAGRWGDARDGGARDHKGVDIFAPRGTPVVAVAAGAITTVETTSSGGRVVWQRDDEHGLMYFYAHLDEQIARAGQRVAPGDVIGRVGNTGNARGSSPHLHFGVFRPGYVAENPTPYLTSSASVELVAAGPSTQLGMRTQLAGDRVRLRASPGENAPIIDQISSGTELLILGHVNGWSRVVLANGTTGFIADWLIAAEPAEKTR
jgi:murein DD-endopeptidase MepM/ murein hydrolase activator NlpD